MLIKDIEHHFNSKKHNGFIDINLQYAVLVPIIIVEEKPHVLFEVRAHNLKKQPGEICFPGGKIEGKETPIDTCIRETMEELNILNNNIKILGPLDVLVTPFNMAIHPFCGVIKNIQLSNIIYNRDEVQSVFVVSLDELLSKKPLKYEMDLLLESKDDFPYHLIENGEEYSFNKGSYPVYFYSHKEFIIWGITARILNSFLEGLKEKSIHDL
ncbi:CoA pyrophosphatase [Alkaliphilus pronyensis]|uniref:CoA pyrophosphatase n=1 Tax=Alkaliphilus pronyensis TaxID=1482732 RepID=A0A6I0F6N5_9FIRM|nr:CoA pyrophosphatase [Alkaliphilus pronyensis]KAB3538621.1 CoA pyrophosphatase [Alkaliphilus pronyensis]